MARVSVATCYLVRVLSVIIVSGNSVDDAVATVVERLALFYRRYWRRLVREDARSKQTPVGEPGSIISIALSPRDEALSRCSPFAIISKGSFVFIP